MAQYDSKSAQTWIFGAATGPTALDAHVVVFLARLVEAGRSNLVTDDLKLYLTYHLSGEAWQSVSKGKPTLHKNALT